MGGLRADRLLDAGCVKQSLIEALRSGPAAREIDRLVAEQRSERDLLGVITDLRSRHDPELASAIAETVAPSVEA